MTAPLLVDTTYADIRGLNYVPSYAATIWDVIDHFDPAVWDREFGYSRRFDANALRIWCDYLSFQRDEKHFLSAWEQALEIAARHDVRIMITMANRWVDLHWPFGQVDYAIILTGQPTEEYRRYVTTFVGAFRDHLQVLMWDLCNEPFVPPYSGEQLAAFLAADDASTAFTEFVSDPLNIELRSRELNFWTAVVETARTADPTQPISIGHIPLDLAEVHDIVDVIDVHAYSGWWDGGSILARSLDPYIELANRLGKPLICSETCQGSLSNETRREIIEVTVRTLEQRKIGWLAWQLMAGEIVTARWDRRDINCRPGDESVMYWVELDGSTRPHHDMAEWRTW